MLHWRHCLWPGSVPGEVLLQQTSLADCCSSYNASMYCLCQVMFIHTAFSTCKYQNTTSYWDFVVSMPGTIPVCYRIYTGCHRKKGPNFGRVFLMLNYTNITQNTCIQSWTVSEIMASEVWNFDSCYTLTDCQIHIETGRNMWFL